ncbi:uncharacterized protein LOC135342923 [Halichondria panicea]|uniref:uncharacterized protein LOC135342923 n=1 Tax=Halichondria panicea TaxID=6063 RepID=UPI00312B4F91
MYLGACRTTGALLSHPSSTSSISPSSLVWSEPLPQNLVSATRMDSFVLAETFKYLFLLFADEGDSPLDDFVFTTEAHLFPLSLASANTTLNRVVQEALLVKNTDLVNMSTVTVTTSGSRLFREGSKEQTSR